MFLSSDNQMKWMRLAVATVVVGALVVMGIAWFDAPVLLFLREIDCKFWHILSAVFDEKIWVGVFFVAAVVFYLKKTHQSKPKTKNDRNQLNLKVFLLDFWQKTKGSNVFFIFYSICVSCIIVQVSKVFIGRARPILFEALDFRGFFPPSLDWVFNSMPSGHTAISFAALVMIGMLAPRFKVLTWSLAILIGVARVCVGAHWPSDVLLGAFIGMVVADIVKWGLNRIAVRSE